MTFVYLICFLLVTVGILFMLKLTPEKITNDLMRFASPKQTLRDKVLTAKGKKKSRQRCTEPHNSPQRCTEPHNSPR